MDLKGMENTTLWLRVLNHTLRACLNPATVDNESIHLYEGNPILAFTTVTQCYSVLAGFWNETAFSSSPGARGWVLARKWDCYCTSTYQKGGREMKGFATIAINLMPPVSPKDPPNSKGPKLGFTGQFFVSTTNFCKTLVFPCDLLNCI